MLFKYCGVCALRTIAGNLVVWEIKALTIRSGIVLCHCGSVAEFEMEAKM